MADSRRPRTAYFYCKPGFPAYRTKAGKVSGRESYCPDQEMSEYRILVSAWRVLNNLTAHPGF